MTGVTLTNDGPDVSGQPSKLWTSRKEYQNLLSTDIPTAPTTPSDPTERLRAAGPTIQAMKASIERIQSQSNPSLPRSRLDSVAIRPMPQCDKNTLSVVSTLQKECTSLAGSLDITGDALRDRVSEARQFVRGALSKAAAINREHPDVQAAKEELLKEIDKLEYSLCIIEGGFSEDIRPVPIDMTRYFTNPAKNLSVLAQIMSLIGVVLNVILGIAQDPCDFLLQTILMITQLAMSVGTLQTEYNAEQCRVLAQLPSSLYSALKNLHLEGEFTTYAVCPACHHLHDPKLPSSKDTSEYPLVCQAMLPGTTGLVPCETPLLQKKRGRLRPIKPYVVPSFTDYLAHLLSDPQVEQLCDKACDDTMERVWRKVTIATMRGVFDALFMHTFEGPRSGKLFIDRGDGIHIAFMWQLDFFSPNPSMKQSTSSIGVMTTVPLNLPADIRYKPEYTYAVVIPGPSSPKLELINSYIRPIMDNFVVGWHHGFRLTWTASQGQHHSINVALVVSASDLPAARKGSSNASHNSNKFMCTCCDCTRARAFTTDWDSWKRHDIHVMRQNTEAYHDALTMQEQNRIFKQHGVQWSEFWRLPYWDPTRMLVADPMHTLLEGLIHYHCRRVLLLDEEQLKQWSSIIPVAFYHDWIDYTEEEYGNDFPMEDSSDVDKIHDLLQRPLEGPESINHKTLTRKLANRRAMSLRFVRHTLRLDKDLLVMMPEDNTPCIVKTKAHIAEQLVQWVHQTGLA